MSNQLSKSRRKFVKSAALTFGGATLLRQISPAWATPEGLTRSSQNLTPSFGDSTLSGDTIEMAIGKESKLIAGSAGRPITINGSSPGPLVRLKEGQHVTINVTNNLSESTSIHWHGLILPYTMDGVPGVSFPGIAAGSTFTYEFDIEQNGTYWYHSHSGLQEQLGHLGPMVIEPKDGDIGADREHTIILSDWTFEDPHDVFRHLKVAEGYYNYQQRTVDDTINDIKNQGLVNTIKERAMWSRMRMNPRDILDVTGATYTYLMNGRDPQTNWTALYKSGESIRLRLINGSAMTYFDFQIPELELTVVAVDGQPVKPVTVGEIRIAVAETYDVIVKPKGTKTYTIFAQSMDRSGYARGTLATSVGKETTAPALRPMPELGMAAMGMSGSHEMAEMGSAKTNNNHGSKANHSSSDVMPEMQNKSIPVDEISIKHSPDGHGPGASMIAKNPVSRLDDPGIGFDGVSHKVLVYSDLTGAIQWPDNREPTQTIELHLTGNMERYMWSFDGKKYTEVDKPVHFKYGERVRLILVNDSMMYHPIHLHGMWMELENGNTPSPRKHTISLKPSEKVSLLISADAPGNWAFHCHLLYHMDAGMFRVVNVS